MHLYNLYIKGGFSETQAKAKVAKILWEEYMQFNPEATTVCKADDKTTLSLLKEKLERVVDESERFRIMNRIEELQTLAKS